MTPYTIQHGSVLTFARHYYFRLTGLSRRLFLFLRTLLSFLAVSPFPLPLGLPEGSVFLGSPSVTSLFRFSSPFSSLFSPISFILPKERDYQVTAALRFFLPFFPLFPMIICRQAPVSPLLPDLGL